MTHTAARKIHGAAPRPGVDGAHGGERPGGVEGTVDGGHLRGRGAPYPWDLGGLCEGAQVGGVSREPAEVAWAPGTFPACGVAIPGPVARQVPAEPGERAPPVLFDDGRTVAGVHVHKLGVALHGRHGGALVGERRQIAGLEALELGPQDTGGFVDLGQRHAGRFPCTPQGGSHESGRVARLTAPPDAPPYSPVAGCGHHGLCPPYGPR